MTVDDSISVITSQTFHIFVWLFVVAGVVGNVLVVSWRCSRKESRSQILSILIVSLAVADLVWCCHYLVQEVMMLKVITTAGNRNETISFTIQDTALCLISTFLSFASCNAIMTTAVGIALHTFFTFGGYRRRNVIVYTFLSISWVSSLAMAASATVDINRLTVKHRETAMSLNRFSVTVMVGCMQGRHVYPVFVTSVNAAASVVCFVVYSRLLYKLKTANLDFVNAELKHLQIRLTIVVLVNVIIWWPPCILYWYSYFRGKTVFNGKLNLNAVMAIMMSNVLITAIDPLIYTMVSTRFTRMIRRACVGMCCHGNNERRILIELESELDASRCTCLTTCWLIRRIRSKVGRARGARSTGSMTYTDPTGSSSLFPEIKRPSYGITETDCESV
ncbi:uncharacterized protein LOC134185283 [Corticium candelabrum]|uniref:uncharacterized protein LOC134185283 n=1 Tax=Corticium candelabrum TaxID=121492 RepID=UPI002E2640A4|nr:uncharacterized protein LOC134185283 [Corticium candelabrum]